ncbi:Hypothetical predicted protein [Mytilus galloprovincialis]|uniref:DUF229 domain containing protein n=1 Tax=Mytilus galloprovincialis TaxID=29158 RepID=A0A8B6CWZ4_MYTGA|nr:Hypothetical predicted protein [Mytilus galloprovincialis]
MVGEKQRSRLWKAGILRRMFAGIIIVGISYFCYLVFFQAPGHFVYTHANTHAQCMIPQINPFDKDILAFFWQPDPIVCTQNTELVYIDDNNTVHINYSRTHLEVVNCSSQNIIRETENDNEVLFKSPVWFSKSSKLTSDFIKVQCYDYSGNLLYERLHYHIHKSVKKFTSDENRFSVLLLGIDGMSRLAAIRELPKTLKYLQDTLQGHILKGYAKVGENTFPNMVAFLAGRIGYSKDFPVDPNVFFDNHPFIWNNFSKDDAVTMYAEDWPRLSTFNYAVPGFNQSPTDHYFRPFYLGINKMRKYQSTINEALLFLENQNIKVGKTSTLCYSDKPKHVLQLDYYKRFLKSYRNKLKFGLSWLNEISHDYVNFIKLADDDLLDFLTFLKEDGHLEKSVLFFVSDHGSRVDKIRNTPIGRIEERMPFFSVVLPQNFKDKLPQAETNLRTNIERLTSPFDFYETIVDIFKNEYSHSTNVVQYPLSRGISLFRNIPKQRSCADAGIHEHNCACYTSEKIPVNNTKIERVAAFVVTKINRDLHHLKEKCVTLTLNTIIEAKLVHSQLKHNEQYDDKKFMHNFIKPKEDTSRRFLILFDVLPSAAMFEATVEETNAIEFSVLGHVSRTNRYGNQSSCINDKRLKLYCFCK